MAHIVSESLFDFKKYYAKATRSIDEQVIRKWASHRAQQKYKRVKSSKICMREHFSLKAENAKHLFENKFKYFAQSFADFTIPDVGLCKVLTFIKLAHQLTL